jgi:dTMP kinase
VIVADVAPEAGTRRADAGGGKKRDSIGPESLEFHRRVRDGFLEIARLGGDRYAVVDAGKPVDEVAASVLEAVERKLGKAEGGAVERPIRGAYNTAC